MEIKKELSHMNWTETCENLYDSSFEVVKEEPYDKCQDNVKLSEVHTLHPVPDLYSNQQNNELSECPKSSNKKLDSSLKYDLRFPDCTQTLGSSTEISTIAYNIQSDICSTELEDRKTQIIPCTLKETHVDKIDTNINDKDDNFKVKADLKYQLRSCETQKPSFLKRKRCYRDCNYENIESFNKLNFSTTNKNETTEDENEPLKKHTKVSSNKITDDIIPVGKYNSIDKEFINYGTSHETNIESLSTVYKVQNTNKIYCKVQINQHNTERLFLCDICNCKFGRKNVLINHMRTHTGEKPFSCNLCNYKFCRKGTLVNHLRTHTGEKPFSCDLCIYKCSHKVSLVNHMKTHTGEKPFSCNLCNYKCGYKGGLVNHMRTHTGEKPFSCNLCNYKFCRKATLVNHLRTHTGEKPFSCNLCIYKCSQKFSLVNHMKTHTGEKPFSCNLCIYKCSQKVTLVNHIKTHTGEKPFSCNICFYKCSQKGNLVNHMKTHTGEKPFSCNLCIYKCSQKGNLVDHMKTHTGEKPFSCKVCFYKCSQKGNLVDHMKTHTGEKPFSCKVCFYKCGKKSNLVSHMRTHAG